MKRLFVGLQIPENVQQTLQQLPPDLMGALWKSPEKYHLTLSFIGNVDEPTAQEVERELSYVRFPAFYMALKEIGYFETGDIPHHLWTGISPDKALRELQEKVANAVRHAGADGQDKFKFHPHVTLAKLMGCGLSDVLHYIEKNNLYHSPEWQVSSFCLFESLSRENGEGKYYKVLREYPLNLI